MRLGTGSRQSSAKQKVVLNVQVFLFDALNAGV
jgi:hypothetical protein